MESCVQYNFRPNFEDRNNEWFFLIVNQRAYIPEIERRIYELFENVEPNIPNIEGSVKGENLKYKLVSFTSNRRVREEDIKKLFKRTKKDINLYHRQSPDGLANFLANQFE